MWAPSWGWIVFANVLLGINQGLAWSTTVIMKIDLVGPKQRGLAMGLNEFAGYLAVALAALATGGSRKRTGCGRSRSTWGSPSSPRDWPCPSCSSGRRHTTWRWRRRTTGPTRPRDGATATPGTREVFALASWRHPALFGASQAGLVTNLKDGLAWGLFPLFFAAGGMSVGQIGTLAFIYPAMWGLLQLWTGGLSDRLGRKRLIAGGMAVQGVWPCSSSACWTASGPGSSPRRCWGWAPPWSTPRCWRR
jgi:MFS family permease